MLKTLATRKFLIIAVLFFLAYMGNVVAGIMASDSQLGVVTEFLLLLVACIAFTVEILRAESHSKKT